MISTEILIRPVRWRRAEKELQERGIVYATLHVSEMGRPLYEKLGWGATNEIGKVLG